MAEGLTNYAYRSPRVQSPAQHSNTHTGSLHAGHPQGYVGCAFLLQFIPERGSTKFMTAQTIRGV